MIWWEESTTEGRVAKGAPSRAWYLVAVLVALLGVAAGGLALLWSEDRAEDLRRFAMPGVYPLPLEHPDSYTIFHDYPSWSVHELELGPAGAFLEITVETSSGELLELRPAWGPFGYTSGERSGRALWHFRTPEPDVYVIEGIHPEGLSGPEVVLSVDRGFERRLLLRLGLGVSLPVLALLATLAIAVVTLLRRRRAAGEAAPTV